MSYDLRQRQHEICQSMFSDKKSNLFYVFLNIHKSKNVLQVIDLLGSLEKY